MRRASCKSFIITFAAVAPLLGMAWGRPALADGLVMKDGRILEGKLLPLPSISNKQRAKTDGSPVPKLIVLIDDGLRRTFVSQNQVQEPLKGNQGDPPERFKLKSQTPASDGGSRITSVGPFKAKDFDKFGRRSVEMRGPRGLITIFQGITEITPTWTKVEGLRLPDATSYTWEQRIATSTIPPDLLAAILHNQINPKNLDQRLTIVRLYLQMERYNEAREELLTIIKDFPEHAEQFSRTERDLRQRYAARILSEIGVRRNAGQHQLAVQMLKSFPHEEVAGETLQKVRQVLDEYQTSFDRGKKILEQIDVQLAQVEDTKLRERLKLIRDELVAELNINTLPRMTSYEQALGDDAMSADEKLSRGLSAWLMGSNQAIPNLAVTASLFTVRNKVREYLEEPIKVNRDELLGKLESEEGATVQYVSDLVAHMLPTRETPAPAEDTPGLYELSVDGPAGEPPITYFVQLPPEYDPHRLYPVVLTLHGGGTNPQQQIDWWAGSQQPDGTRTGQATRHGYIVIAPLWAKEQQDRYNYSLLEHTAVLNSLRDACRRFSVDTDRVFLSGHSIGGDAAWDIGLAHPDLWAGVIPIVAVADKYVQHYWKEAAFVPFYIVSGEMDGDKTSRNSGLLDKWFSMTGVNVTLAEFLGRGHEHFADEVLRIFDWMGRFKRDFARKKFTGTTLRPWDNFFWWVELSEFRDKALVDPSDWPPVSGTRPALTEGWIGENNTLHVKTGAEHVTIWLSPELVDFDRKITISVNASSSGWKAPEPSLSVLLEDVRTRAARLHPFWAKVEKSIARGSAAKKEPRLSAAPRPISPAVTP